MHTWQIKSTFFFYFSTDSNKFPHQSFEEERRWTDLNLASKQFPAVSSVSRQDDMQQLLQSPQTDVLHTYSENSGKCFCNICGRLFFTGGGLYKHKKIVHGRTEDLIPCPECDQKFVTQSALKRHLPKHSTERPHVCQICGKAYKHKDALNSHSCR